MPSTFDIFTDALLTTPAPDNLPFVGSANIGSPPVDHQYYFGSPTAGRQVRASSAPGADPITVSVTDASPFGGQPATDVYLATTQAGLATATGGAPLALGSTILGGAGNAVSFWVRLADSTHMVMTNRVELGLLFNPLTESAV